MASSSPDSSEELAPAQLLFARAVLLAFDLWPAMRMAVSEQWGGVDSAAKRDYLVSHIVDEYGGQLVPLAAHTAATSSSEPHSSSLLVAPSGQRVLVPPPAPDQDELADVLDDYVKAEYDVHFEDGSTDWMAARLVQLHRRILGASTTEHDARVAVQQLEEAAAKLGGTKASWSTAPEQEEVDAPEGDSDDDEDDDEQDDRVRNGGGGDGMDVDGQATQAQPPSRPRRARPEAVVDEDGFTTVVRRR